MPCCTEAPAQGPNTEPTPFTHQHKKQQKQQKQQHEKAGKAHLEELLHPLRVDGHRQAIRPQRRVQYRILVHVV